MKKILLITFVLIGISQVRAIAQDITYFDADWHVTAANNASYFRKKLKTDSGWQVTDCFISGKIQMAGFYSDDSCKINEGEFTYYDDSGHLHHRCNYVHGKMEGAEILYYDNGGKRTEGVNKAGKRNGEWIGYYPSGKLSAKALYKDGNQASGSFFNEDGTTNTMITQFWKFAAYPGGEPALYGFIGKTVKYPDKAIKKNIHGMVIIGFNITKEGKMSEIEVVQSIEKSLDKEALRVVRLLGNWEPGIIGGILCDTYYKLPVEFKLED